MIKGEPYNRNYDIDEGVKKEMYQLIKENQSEKLRNLIEQRKIEGIAHEFFDINESD